MQRECSLATFEEHILSTTSTDERIARIGIALLRSDSDGHDNALGDKKWEVMSRVIKACAPFALGPWMMHCCRALRERFPSSSRVLRLAALTFEATDQKEQALRIYNTLLESKPSDLDTRKRLIALLRSSGKINEAMAMLNNHLSEFQLDVAAWQELADIYQEHGHVAQALFCYEELLLIDPHNFTFLVSYAEILASSGKCDAALEYYAAAVKICPDSPRALWGIIACAEHTFPPSLRAPAEEQERATLVATLTTTARDRLHSIYTEVYRVQRRAGAAQKGVESASSVWTRACLDLVADAGIKKEA